MQGRPGRSRAARRPTARKGLTRGVASQTANVFSTRLAEARKRAGLTQVDLAKALDRNQSAISHIERGHIGRMADLLRNAARELGVSADYLLGLTDTPVCDVCEMRNLHEGLQALLGQSDGKVDRLSDAIDLLLAHLDHADRTGNDSDRR